MNDLNAVSLALLNSVTNTNIKPDVISSTAQNSI